MAWRPLLLLACASEAAMFFRHRRSTCEKFAFLRIQKTGSTTFEDLISDMTPGLKYAEDKQRWRMPLTHINYQDIQAEMPISCAVVLLRDPVERFLSEFSMLRSSDATESAMLDEDQWDFGYFQLKDLHYIRNNESESKALMDFINFPDNPSRNRQALYLIGFNRVTCRRSRWTGTQCCGVCVENPDHIQPPGPGGTPGADYDWDQNEEELLALAKQHLDEMLTFGITDCYEASIRAMAPKLGWHRDIAVVNVGHQRVAHPELSLLSTLDPKIQELIRRKNRVDDELVKYARKLFYLRNGFECK